MHKGTVDSSMANIQLNTTQGETFAEWEKSFDGLALDKEQYYVFWVCAIVATIWCLFSIFGFVGAVFAKRALVAFYSTSLWILLVANLVLGIYNCYSVVHRRQSIVDSCLQQVNNPNSSSFANDENKLTADACNAASKAGIAVVIALVVVELLLQLYACVIVKRYVEQLGEEQGYRRHLAGNRVNKGGDAPGAYYPHQPLGSHEMSSGPYPYADPAHSYGNA